MLHLKREGLSIKAANKIGKYLLLAGLAFFITAQGITAFLYNKVFARRFEATDNLYGLTLSDFPDLDARPALFQSGKELLYGNFYRSTKTIQQQNALLLYCHGFSNGSRDYLAQINYFAQQGFEVLAYDNTGCHASTGKGVYGFPQAVINLADVLHALTKGPSYTAYHQKPLILMGHSWGGYAVNAVLNTNVCETVQGVVSFSAPNDSLGILMEQGRRIFGEKVVLLKPFLWLMERVRFGMVATYSGCAGVNRTSAPVLILYSMDDPVVPYQNALAYQSACFTNSNVKIGLMENRGHQITLTEDARAYGKWLANYEKAQKDQPTDSIEQFLQGSDKLQIYQLDRQVLEPITQFLQESLAIAQTDNG